MPNFNVLAVALYISSMITLALQTITTAIGFPVMNPISAILVFLFFQELSKLVVMFTGNENGEDS